MGIGNVIAYTTHSRSGSGDPVFDMKRCLEHRLMPLRKLTILHIVLEVELQAILQIWGPQSVVEPSLRQERSMA
jgi:hypothetical protein